MAEMMLKKEEHPAEIATLERTRSGDTYSPRVDIWENDDELVVYADLPGVPPENLEVRFENRELTIFGKVEPRHPEIPFLFGEYGIGDFYRSFTVGEMIDSQKITAELHHGVLALHLPKTEAIKPRKIEVKSM